MLHIHDQNAHSWPFPTMLHSTYCLHHLLVHITYMKPDLSHDLFSSSNTKISTPSEYAQQHSSKIT